MDHDKYEITQSLSIRNALIRNKPSNSSIIRNDDPLNLLIIRNEFSDKQLRNSIAIEIFSKRCQKAAYLIKTNANQPE